MRLLKSLMAAGVAVAMSLTAGTAAAGPSGGYDWTGPYAGAVASAGLFTVEQEDYWCWYACNAPTLQDWDASIGVQVGNNWQSGNFVYGVVADWSTGFEQTENVTFSGSDGVIWEGKWNSYGTIRGRAGIAAGDALVFATAGIAIIDADYRANEVDTGGDSDCATHDCALFNDTSIGFAGGVGVGTPVGDKMHMTFEYLYIGTPWEKDIYNTANAGTDDYVSWTTSAHIGRVSLVWEFDGL